MEYAWFNNVETKPGIGYPRNGRTRTSWNGGWMRKANGKIEPRQGGEVADAGQASSPIRNLPEIDDYYEPFTFDYEHLQIGAGNEGDADRAPASA